MLGSVVEINLPLKNKNHEQTNAILGLAITQYIYIISNSLKTYIIVLTRLINSVKWKTITQQYSTDFLP